MPIISIANLHFSYLLHQKEVYALRGINLEIERGTINLLCGPTGCGKSTLIRTLNGLVPHFYTGKLAGDVIVAGKNTRDVSTRDLSLNVGMVFQNPENQLFALNVEREVAFGPENLGLSREEIQARIDASTAIMGISHLLEKNPLELSGGEQQRVAIASVIALSPDILVLDEPTSSLDPHQAAAVISLLNDLKAVGKTIIIVEHRLELILPITDKVVTMDSGKITGTYHPRELIQNLPNTHPSLEIPMIVDLFMQLREMGLFLQEIPLTLEEATSSLRAMFGGKSR